MCIAQQLPSGLEIFGYLSDFMITSFINNPSSNIFFTTDQYGDASIKLCESNRGSASGSIKATASRRDQKLPKQFKEFFLLASTNRSWLSFCYIIGVHIQITINLYLIVLQLLVIHNILNCFIYLIVYN